MLSGALMFAAALVLLFSILYSAIETIMDALPEHRLKRALQFGGLSLLILSLFSMDVPAAMTALTAQVPFATAAPPVLKSLTLALFIAGVTAIHSARSARLKGVDPRYVRVVSGVMIVSTLSILAGLAFAAFNEREPINFLQERSQAASWTAALAIFITSASLVYPVVFNIIHRLPLWGFALIFLIGYYMLFALTPPQAVVHALAEEDYLWADALRQTMFCGVILLVTIPLTLHYEERAKQRAMQRAFLTQGSAD